MEVRVGVRNWALPLDEPSTGLGLVMLEASSWVDSVFRVGTSPLLWMRDKTRDTVDLVRL